MASAASPQHGAACVGIGTAPRRQVAGVRPQGGGAPGALGLQAKAAAEGKRWADLEMWLACSLSVLETCARCVTWKTWSGPEGGEHLAGLAYVRLLTLVLRLVSPASGGGLGGNPTDDFLNGEKAGAVADAGGLVAGGGAYGLPVPGGDAASVTNGSRGGVGRRLGWARERLAHVVDDLMWRLREGLPERDVRLPLLKVRRYRWVCCRCRWP